VLRAAASQPLEEKGRRRLGGWHKGISVIARRNPRNKVAGHSTINVFRNLITENRGKGREELSRGPHWPERGENLLGRSATMQTTFLFAKANSGARTERRSRRKLLEIRRYQGAYLALS